CFRNASPCSPSQVAYAFPDRPGTRSSSLARVFPLAVAGEVDHPGQLLRPPSARVDVMPDVLAEAGDILEPGLVRRELDQFGFDGPPHRLPRRPELPGESLDGGVLATQLPDRP